MPAGGSVSGASVSRVTPGERFPRRALPPWAQVRTTTADSVALAVACLISYWLTTSILSLAYSASRDDDALGGMWAVIATVFVFRTTYTQSLAAALSRMAATVVSFVLCLAYLAVLPFHPWGPGTNPSSGGPTPQSVSPSAWRPRGWAGAPSAAESRHLTHRPNKRAAKGGETS